ncbi:hypothetical protein PENTCL1PPCAC_22086, partial [Pristionchus entomophagus]
SIACFRPLAVPPSPFFSPSPTCIPEREIEADMVTENEVYQSVTTYKLVLRKIAMIFPKYEHVFYLPSADYGRQSTEPDRSGEVQELDYGRGLDTVGETRTRSVQSSVKVIAFALSAIIVAIVLESSFHIL